MIELRRAKFAQLLNKCRRETLEAGINTLIFTARLVRILTRSFLWGFYDFFTLKTFRIDKF
jgi:hypothetical protein